MGSELAFPGNSPLPAPRRRARLAAAVALSGAAHVGVLVALMSVNWRPPPVAAEIASIPVALAPWPQMTAAPAPAPSPSPTPTVAPKAPQPKASVFRRAPPRPAPAPAPVADAPGEAAGMSDAELAGATFAGSSGGGGGRPCDMAARLQAALGRDQLAEDAVAGLSGRAIKVWDGDWIWQPGEEGKGLPAVRQALMWEIAFAPEACRREPVRGLVVLRVPEPGGSVRLALGAAAWRWTDLLTPRSP
jgi:hypothetical protein